MLRTKQGKRITRMGIVGAIVTLGITVTGCSGSAGAPEDEAAEGNLDDMEPIVLTVNDFGGEKGPAATSMKAFQEEVTANTDGKVTFENFYGGVLLTTADSLTGIGDGRADIGLHVPSFSPQELPIANALYGLTAAPEPSFPHYALMVSAAVEHMASTNEAYIGEFEKNNVKLLAGTSGTMGYDLVCKEPFDGPEDVEGRRVVAAGSTWVAQAEAVGMVQVDIPVGELYEGLQRGIVDCVIVNTGQLENWGLWEVAKYFAPNIFAANPGITFIMNGDRWRELPKDVQEIMTTASRHLFAEYAKFQTSATARVATAGVEEHDLQFQDTSGWAAALSDVNESQRELSIETIAAAGVEDAEAFADDYQGVLDSWLEVLVDDVGYPLTGPGPQAQADSYADLDEAKVIEFVELVNEKYSGTK